MELTIYICVFIYIYIYTIVCVSVCVSVYVCSNVILISGEISTKWTFFLQFQQQSIYALLFTLYVLHASHNVLIFIGKLKKYF
jgi:hypothetical protein